MKTKLRGVAVGVTLMTAAGLAQAAGFALYENNASGLGTAFAGQAAVAQDASTIFFNPAGLTQIEGRQLVGAMTYLKPSGKFTNDGSSTLSGYGNGGDAAVSAWVPGAFYAMDLDPNLKLGIGIFAPFGLATDYDDPWVGKTQALYSHVQTINVNPTLAWKLNDKVSLGFGINWQKIEAELSSSTGVAPDAAELTMKGDDSSWGWNVGALFELDEASRIGIAYRSRIKQELTGEATLNGALLTSITADLTLPDMASVSYFRKLNPQWDLLADVTWTGWSTFEKLEAPEVPPSGYSVRVNWEDAWRFTLGTQYHANETWTWRAGLAFDQTPIPDPEHRTARIPDEDRISIAVGAQYRVSKQTRLDFGYMHIFFDDAKIRHPENGVQLNGSFDVAADILGAQFTYNF